MKNFMIFPLFLVTINSCQMKSQEIILNGKIALELDDTCTIYSDSDTLRFELLNKNGKRYGSLNWMNNKDIFVATEGLKTSNRKNLKSNLILLDTNGQLIKKLYESSPDEFVGFCFPSPSD